MKKAKNAAIICGMITSFLFGGYYVVEAATVTLDESSADLVDVFYYNENDYETKEILTAEAPERRIKRTNRITVIEEKPVEIIPVVSETVEETNVETETPTVVDAPAAVPAPVEEAPAPVENAPAEETPAPTNVVAPVVETAEPIVFEAAPIITADTTTVEIEKPVEEFEEINYSAPVNQLETPPAPVVEVAQNNENTFVETGDPVIFEIPEIQEIEETVANSVSASAPITEAEYILICNCVANEAGSDNINETEKAKVVEVIMNRVASKSYPNTIYGVISQKYQFEGSSAYVNLTTFSKKVTPMVKSAVDLYFSDPSAFSHGYTSFYGDGVRNYFR